MFTSKEFLKTNNYYVSVAHLPKYNYVIIYTIIQQTLTDQ